MLSSNIRPSARLRSPLQLGGGGRFQAPRLLKAFKADGRTGIRLNFFVRLVSDSSTASRSRLDAPTKPTQSVCWLMKAASSGVQIGPPCDRNRISRPTLVAPLMIARSRFTPSSLLQPAPSPPIQPPCLLP